MKCKKVVKKKIRKKDNSKKTANYIDRMLQSAEHKNFIKFISL